MGAAQICKPFFCFYGAKWRATPRYYPPPDYDTIVEPFAGSAGYSVRHAGRNIILCDIDPVIVGVWRYLIRSKAVEILAIPDLGLGESVDDLKIPEEAKWLVGFWVNKGVARPCKSASKWMRAGTHPGSFWGPRIRNRIALQVDAIRHWKIHHGTYEDCPAPDRATWFVDPPYQVQGTHYRFGSDQIDYEGLARWCTSRPGQVIVCENSGASWLPFRDLADLKTTRVGRKSREVVWTK